MRFVSWVVLVLLAVLSVWSGQLALALALAGVKATLVGLEYMELRQAHRAQAQAFVAGVVSLVVLLEFVTRAAPSK